MPVEVLAEFACYRDLVIAVAKEVYRTRHPRRQRVPKGFAQSFQLSIKEVQPGSAMPVLLRARLGAVLTLPNLSDEFEEARDLIAETIRCAESGQPLPKGFPRHALRYFGDFGRSLHADESMELLPPRAKSGVVYAPTVRKKLLRQSETTYEETVVLMGRVTEVDYLKRTFLFNPEDEGNRRISGSYPTELHEDLNHVAGRSTLVQVVGLAQFGPGGRIEKLVSLDELWSAKTIQIRDRLESLLLLESGWLDGRGEKLDEAHVDQVREALMTAVSASEIESTRIFPTPEGGIEAEWTVGGWEIAATFQRSGAVEVSAVNVRSGAEVDQGLQLSALAEDNGEALAALFDRCRTS